LYDALDKLLLTYSKLSRMQSTFRSFTGLEVSEFDSLYQKVRVRYEDSEKERLTRPRRKREIGGGGKFKLELRDRLLMLLVYYRLYVTFTLAGFLFDLDQSNVFRDIRYLEPLVSGCLPLPKKVHQNLTRRLRTIEEVEQFFPGFKAFVDATEQEIPRPKKDSKKRKSHYSGKRRKHTVKTQLTVNKEGLIFQKTNHARGRRHDLDVYLEHPPALPKEVEQDFDRGYDGVKNYFPDLKCAIPFKRRGRGRGHRGEKAPDLTPEQKKFNHELSKERVVVEHTISRMKKFRIMADEFRNRLKHYDRTTDIVSGLVNFRIMGTRGLLL
jgi:DDE superfamily endonuclease/Helix-turn-helix of DDE superfamily endonuclease